MPDVDIDRICTMYQQTWPVRRVVDIRHVDGNLNLTDATFTAFHVSLFALWTPSPPALARRWWPRRWRFKAHNADPGALQGGLAETTFVPAWGDVHRGAVASRWRRVWQWRNKSRVSDFLTAPASLGDAASIQWVPFGSVQHLQWRARLRAWQGFLGLSSSQQQFVQTQAQATTSVALGDIHYTGGGFVLP